MNTLVMSFWIHAPSKITLKYRFGDGGDFSKIMSRFQFNKYDQNRQSFTSQELNEVKKYYGALVRIIRKRGRLFTALSSSFMGCLQYNWRSSYLLYATALAAMLTYSASPGITKRLSKAFACLISTDHTKRDNYYKRFYLLYNIRSDIIHGRTRKYSKPVGNLKKLSMLTEFVRKLWQKILLDPNILNFLEQDDLGREKFFKSIEKGYVAPHV